MRGKWQAPWVPDQEKYRAVNIVHYGQPENEFQTLYIHRPAAEEKSHAVIWFHGGGMTCDDREVPDVLFDGQTVVVEPRYRLSPQYPAVSAIQDAADAVARFLTDADTFGVDRSRIFVGGMSAGAYLAALISMDRSWLAARGHDARTLAGIILISGQMTTHFQLKKDLGYSESQFAPVMDRFAPLAHLSADLPPMLMLTGESGRDIPARPEENAFMAASLIAMGHKNIRCIALAGRDHGGAFDSCDPFVREFVQNVLNQRESRT